MANAKKTSKKRVVSVESHGQVHIQATFNNIIISITNNTGQVISWSSAGKMGFKGSKKNTRKQSSYKSISDKRYFRIKNCRDYIHILPGLQKMLILN